LAALTMPRTITQMRSAAPYFSSIARTISSTVLTSARLPANTSKESGRPSGVQTKPMQTCWLPLRWAAENGLTMPAATRAAEERMKVLRVGMLFRG